MTALLDATHGAAVPRTPARGEAIRHGLRKTTLGFAIVAASDKGVCALLIGDDPAALEDQVRAHFRDAAFIGPDAAFDRLADAVADFIDHPKMAAAFPLDLRGTPFQLRVWEALREIRSGETASYGEIAARIGAPKAARAVGAACGANRIALAVPCHRVLGARGAIGGFAWGVERKRALLARERTASARGAA